MSLKSFVHKSGIGKVAKKAAPVLGAGAGLGLAAATGGMALPTLLPLLAAGAGVGGAISASAKARRANNAADDARKAQETQVQQSQAAMNQTLADAQKKAEQQKTDLANQTNTNQTQFDQFLAQLKASQPGQNQTAINTAQQGYNQNYGDTQNQLNTLLDQRGKTATDALNQALTAQQTVIAPQLEAQYASRGLPLTSGAFMQSLAGELAKQNMQKADLANQLSQERMGALGQNVMNQNQSNVGLTGQGLGMTREDLLNGRQAEMNNFLQKLGFSQQNQSGFSNISNQLNFQDPLSQQQNNQNMWLNMAQNNVTRNQNVADQSKQRQYDIENALGNLAGNYVGSKMGNGGTMGNAGTNGTSAMGSSGTNTSGYNNMYSNPYDVFKMSTKGG